MPQIHCSTPAACGDVLSGVPVYKLVATIAVDDTHAPQVTVGVAETVSVSANDTAAGGVITYVLEPTSLVGLSAVTPPVSTDGNFDVTADGSLCDWEFTYEIYRDGVATGETATVDGKIADGTYFGPNVVTDSYFANEPGAIVVPGNPVGDWFSDSVFEPTAANGDQLPNDASITFRTIPQAIAPFWNLPAFAGDAPNGVAAGNTALDSNGHSNAGVYFTGPPTYSLFPGQFRVAYQTIPVTPGVAYQVSCYITSTLTSFGGGDLPQLLFDIDGRFAETGGVRDAITTPPLNAWQRMEKTFVAPPGKTSIEIGLWDFRTSGFGDDLGLTAFEVKSKALCLAAGAVAAVDDAIAAPAAVGTALAVDMSNGDTTIAGTSWHVDPNSFVGVAEVQPLVSITGPADVYVDGTACDWSFEYELFVDGSPTGERATVSGSLAAGTYYGPNMLGNPDFADIQPGADEQEFPVGTVLPGGWQSDSIYKKMDHLRYFSDLGGADGIDDGEITFRLLPDDDGLFITQTPRFLGDLANGVAGFYDTTLVNGFGVPEMSYLDSNGHSELFHFPNPPGHSLYPNPFRVVYQTVPVTPNTTYRLVGYALNNSTDETTANPILQFDVDGAMVGPVYDIDEGFPTTGAADAGWIRMEHTFTTGPGQTTAEVGIWDSQARSFGDNLTLTRLYMGEQFTCP